MGRRTGPGVAGWHFRIIFATSRTEVPSSTSRRPEATCSGVNFGGRPKRTPRVLATLLQGSQGWHPGPDRGSRAALRLTRDARLALQAEPGPTPPHPRADAQGHELARVRREPAPARQRDGLVFGRGGRGVGGRAAHEPGRAARVFRPGDPDGADVQGRVPAGVPADRGADRLRHRLTRARPRRAGPHHPVPPAATLEVPRPKPRGDGAESGAGRDTGPMHLLVDSTGLKLYGAGEWLVEKHGTKRRRSWRKLHLGVDAETGRIVAAPLTARDEDDASQVGPLLDQVEDPVASFTADGAYAQESVYADVAERHPEAAVIVPPRSTAVPSATAETAPTQRDCHLQLIAEKGRMGWQKATGYNARARAEATIGRFKRVIGDGLRSRTDERRATEMDVAVQVLNRMLELGRPESARIA